MLSPVIAGTIPKNIQISTYKVRSVGFIYPITIYTITGLANSKSQNLAGAHNSDATHPTGAHVDFVNWQDS